MILSHSKKFVFIHVHRTGGTSLTNLLLKQVPDLQLDKTQHRTIRTLGSTFIEEHLEFEIFGFTRNPWSRMLSWYFLKHRLEPLSLEGEKKRFEHYLENDLALKGQSNQFSYNTLDYFRNQKGAPVKANIYRYEAFESEIERLCENYDISFDPIEKLNSSGMQDYRLYYTSMSKQLIAEKCKKDIAYFKYQF